MVALVNHRNNVALRSARRNIVGHNNIVRIHFDVDFRTCKVGFFALRGYEITFLVERRTRVKLCYVALEFSVSEFDFVRLGDNSVVPVDRIDLFHKVYSVGFYSQSDNASHGRGRRALYDYFEFPYRYGYFVVNALKYRRYDFAFKPPLRGRAYFYILGTHDDVYKLVDFVIVKAIESSTAEFYF